MTNLIYPLDVVKRLKLKWPYDIQARLVTMTAHDRSTGELRDTLNAERTGRWRSAHPSG